MSINDCARIVIRSFLSKAFEESITDKQYEYIARNYPNVVKAILNDNSIYRQLYSIIRREALEYEYGFRQ